MAYFLTAVTSLALTRGADGIATMWPPSGLLLAILLLAQPAMVPRYIATASIASFAANVMMGSEVGTSIGFTIANMVESLLGAWLLRLKTECRPSFVNPAGLKCFCTASGVAAVTSAALACIVTPVPSVAFYLSWFTTDLLGILIVAPIVLISAELFRTPKQEIVTVFRWPEAIMLLAGVTGITTAVFAQSSYPLLFLPMASVIVAVFRLGPFGAAASVLIIALVSSVAISLGHGPPALIQAGHDTKIFFLQFYLLSLLSSAMPIAALLAGRQRLLNELAEKHDLLEQARQSAERSATDALTLAETDQLTGLPNRRKALHVLEHVIATAQGPSSIAIFDLDYFKAVNDRFGHAVGDHVLCRVARDASAVLREADLIGRYGGEEFILVLPNTAAEQAMAVAERVRASIATGGTISSDDPNITASIGLASLIPGEAMDSLIKRADIALYAAKKAGRNLLRLAA